MDNYVSFLLSSSGQSQTDDESYVATDDAESYVRTDDDSYMRTDDELQGRVTDDELKEAKVGTPLPFCTSPLSAPF